MSTSVLLEFVHAPPLLPDVVSYAELKFSASNLVFPEQTGVIAVTAGDD
jgi:hypothetical protein